MSVIDKINKNIPILVVDDFATMRKIVRKQLETLGFKNITEAEDGDIAFEKLENNKFELIISDWNMPNMMGLEFLRKVRAKEGYQDVLFLMVTAESQKANVLDAAQAGASAYIIKPFTIDLLKAKLEQLFGGK
jgi:two-component system chemotaxis response regulator CheY